MSENYYVYAYLREDGTPYYIGKGKDGRITAKHNVSVPKDESRRKVLRENLSETAAHELEIELIAHYGRKDLGTGILRNMTDGGEGTSGWVPKDTTKENISKALKALGDEHHSKRPDQRERARKQWLGENNPMHLPEQKERARQLIQENNPAKTEEFSKTQSEYQFNLGEKHNWRSEEYRKSQREKMTGDGNIAKREDVRKKLSDSNPMKNPESVELVRQAALAREKIPCPHCGKMCGPHGIGQHIKSCKHKETTWEK
jgi:hypothetical protein